jgi:Peptidase family S41
MRRLLAAAFACTLVVSAQAQTAAPEFGAEQAQRDLRILKRAFTELHPGLYRYTTPAQFDAEFAAAEEAVKQGSTRAEMFLLASRLAAAVRCGHTWVSPYNQSKAVVDGLFARSDKLPLTLRFVEGRALITGSLVDGLKAGAELLAVDGRPVSEIQAALLPYLRADGEHEGARAKRLSQLDSGANGGAMDRLFPLRFPPLGGRYRLRVADAPGAQPRDIDAAAVSLAERDKALPADNPQWTFRVDGEVATLTIPTFAFWRSDFKPEVFLARAFGAMRNVPYLVIDLRRNEGGDDAIGRLLLSHLLREPASFPGYGVESAYERVPYVLARYLDTWDFSFFDRTGQVSKGPGRNWLLPDRPGARIEPNALHYPGRVIALIGPQNSSAGFLLARAFQSTGTATLVGQTTGGNVRGLNGGQLAWITLPASGVGVDIPLLASVYAGNPPDAGVTPDMPVAPRFADAAAGVDTEMRAAFDVIGRWKAAAAPRP